MNLKRIAVRPTQLSLGSRSLTAIGSGLAASAVLLGCSGVEPLAEWAGDCPYEDGTSVSHVALVGLSASERSIELLERRLEGIESHARQAADCESRFVAVVIDGGRATVIFDENLDSKLGTEVARDLKIPVVAREAMAKIRDELEPHLQGEPPEVSDPGVVFRFLDELEAGLGPDEEIAALVYSDGVTRTETLDLNRPLSADEIDDLAVEVATVVDLGGRVSIDWRGVGLTVDPVGPPSSWLDDLTAVWRTACQTRGATSCLITTST